MECFDAISPWTVGRFTTDKECELWGEGRMKGDADCIAEWTEERGSEGKVDYVPVVLPGFSVRFPLFLMERASHNLLGLQSLRGQLVLQWNTASRWSPSLAANLQCKKGWSESDIRRYVG